jgi:hypothetical protein
MSSDKHIGFYYENIFSKNQKIGYGITTWNSIPSSNTVTEFSKTFPVFYKWPDLTDVQGIVTSTVYNVQCHRVAPLI